MVVGTVVFTYDLCLFGLPLQVTMESGKSSERQQLLERLLEAVKQVTEFVYTTATDKEMFVYFMHTDTVKLVQLCHMCIYRT